MDVYTYLSSIGLPQYADAFARNGYETVEDIASVTMDELCADIGLKKFHARKVMKNLNAVEPQMDDDEKNQTATVLARSHVLRDDPTEVSLVFLGETGVGKTTLLESLKDFIRGTPFDEIHSTEKPQEAGKSQTKDPHRENLRNDEYKVTLIDTPGIADTEGIASDQEHVNKITKFLGDMVAFNAICIVLPCSVTRATVQLRYIVGEIKANLPKDAEQNFVVVLTRAAGVVMPSGDAIAVIKQLGLPLNNIFLVDNRAYESLSEEHRQEMPELYKRARQQQRLAFADNHGKLRILLDDCARYPKYQGSKVKALRIKRHQLKASVANCKKVIDNCFRQEKEVARMQQNLREAQGNAARLSQTVQTMKNKKIPYEVFEPHPQGYIRTVCSICGDSTNCHNPCGLSYGDPIEHCSSLYTGRCTGCGCAADKHAHSKLFPVTKYRSMFEQSSDRHNLESNLTAAERQKRQFERNMIRLNGEMDNLRQQRSEHMQSISELYKELESMAIVGFNESFEEYLTQCMEQVDRDGSLTTEAAREKKTLFRESISQFRVIVSAARDAAAGAWNWIRGEE